MVRVRRLPLVEGDKLHKLFAEAVNGTPPLPSEGMVIVAEEDGVIIGFATLQYVPHIEPVWVAPSHRGRWVLQNMLTELFKHVPTSARGALCYTKEDRTARLITHLGLEHMHDWKVFRWVRGE